MPGPLLHVGITALCAHAGQAQPVSPNPRVLVNGMPTLLQPGPWVVSGCPFNVSGGPSPCLTAQWITGSTRVLSNGQPLLLADSQAVCAPNGTPVTVTGMQTRAIAT